MKKSVIFIIFLSALNAKLLPERPLNLFVSLILYYLSSFASSRLGYRSLCGSSGSTLFYGLEARCWRVLVRKGF